MHFSHSTQSTRDTTDQHEPLALRGPEPGTLCEAIAEIESHAVPGLVSIDVLRTIESAAGFPFSVGTRTIDEASIRSGDPQHGAKRSDAHVRLYEMKLPIRELDYEAIDTEKIDLDVATGIPEPSCDECENREAFYRYQDHQHEVRWVIVCSSCGAGIATSDE